VGLYSICLRAPIQYLFLLNNFIKISHRRLVCCMFCTSSLLNHFAGSPDQLLVHKLNPSMHIGVEFCVIMLVAYS